ALVATAPGQPEAVLVGRDGHLYHLRRKNGSWLAPARIDDSTLTALPVGRGGGSFPLRNPSLLQAGNKLLLLFQDDASRLFGAAFDLETGYWGQAALVRDSGVFQQQTAVLCGDGWIELAYRRFDNHVSHQEGATQLDNIGPSTGSAFGFADPKDAGGEVNGPPTLVCSGYRTLELLSRGSDDALWHARSHGFSWSSWQEENEHLFGSLFAWKI